MAASLLAIKCSLPSNFQIAAISTMQDINKLFWQNEIYVSNIFENFFNNFSIIVKAFAEEISLLSLTI